MPQSSNFARHHDAMDTTADRTHSWPTAARLAHAEEVLAGSQAPRPPFRARGGIPPRITPRGACFSCRQWGHFARQCPQYPNRQETRDARARITEVDNDESDTYQAIHVARAVTDMCTPQQKADKWLSGVAGESDEVKDKVLQALWKREEGFQGA